MNIMWSFLEAVLIYNQLVNMSHTEASCENHNLLIMIDDDDN